MVKVLITGATGLVGTFLQAHLRSNNYVVSILTRTPKNANEYHWDIENNQIDTKAFTKLDYIIHLAGAGIANKRWTTKRKHTIVTSRVKSTQLLFKYVSHLKTPLKGFISASAVGYYGAITTHEAFTETDPPSKDFLGRVCTQWEKAVLQFEELQIPTTILRTGIVLSKNGGALPKMNTPFAIFPLANGKQYMPWIHILDLSKLFTKAMEDSNFIGIFNAVAPSSITNFNFSSTLAKKTGKVFIPIGIPAFLLKLVLGEMAVLLIKGSKISAQKVENFGFDFSYKIVDKALEDSIQKS